MWGVRFKQSSLMDRFLHTAILYFVTLFQIDALKNDGTVSVLFCFENLRQTW
jgi:1,4-alpha-glucan branching enzyme